MFLSDFQVINQLINYLLSNLSNMYIKSKLILPWYSKDGGGKVIVFAKKGSINICRVK